MNRKITSHTAASACGVCISLASLALIILMLMPAQLFARSLPNHQFIVGGQSENRYPAVAALIEDNEATCTGTLIAPTYLLTAAHCLFESSEGASVFFGADARDLSSGVQVPVDTYIPHRLYADDDFYDIGLVRLAEAAPIEPIPYATQLDESIIGQNPLFIGYGVVDAYSEEAGEKRSVSIQITELTTDSFTYAGTGVNTCFGDSGGPALLELNGALQVIGVTSWGDDYCEEFGVNTRTDTYDHFIQCVLAGGDSQCGDVVEGTPGGPADGEWSDTENELPDDWCTDDDGWCDEPCEPIDSDCLDDGDEADTGDKAPTPEETDNSMDPSTQSGSPELNDSSDETPENTASSNGSTLPNTSKNSEEAGGCTASPVDSLGLLLLVGVGVIRRQRRRGQ
ncbi:MAG: trypsin-like serine protease [Myxococcota bacterium]|nr:trypsin-like serine protease [Myxococcota bacterium]